MQKVRAVLEEALIPEDRVKLGSLLADIGWRARLTDDEVAGIENVRDRAPPKPLSLK